MRRLTLLLLALLIAAATAAPRPRLLRVGRLAPAQGRRFASYPGALESLLEHVRQRTAAPVAPEPLDITDFADPRLLQLPLVYANFADREDWSLSPAEATALKGYLQRGGLLFIDAGITAAFLRTNRFYGQHHSFAEWDVHPELAETFLKLTPYLSVVLNIDNDHLDYYGSMGELKFAFKRFALMTQFMIFANADDKNTMDVMYTLDRRVRTFAIDNHGDYRAVNVNEYKPGFFEFDLKEWNTTETTRIRLSVPGRHNIYNALAMCAVCRFVGLSAEQCAEAALNFKGAGRRFEVYGECNGALVIDDYAHHPTELRATLNTAKEMGYKRLIAVHQPFTYSRTKMLFNDFVDVLKIPDITVLTPIMGSREPNDPTITSAKLAAQIPGSVLVNSLQEAADWVKQNAQPGDLVITLGCGDIYKASKMMVEKDQ